MARLAKLALSPIFGALALALLVIQVQWGLWASQDLPSIDEAWALTDGFRLAHGGRAVAISWWNSPLYTLLYAATASIMRTVEATFYAQRLALTLLSVLTLYWLLRRLLPNPSAWLGAAWFAVSPLLVDLELDRSDFLAASACTWAALALLRPGSMRRTAAALVLAMISFLFRPEYILVVVGIAFYGLADALWGRLPMPAGKRWLLIGCLAVGLTLAAGGVSLALIKASPSVDAYFMSVFANNRRPYDGAYTPFWELYERDYGPEHSITAVLSHPVALARDMVSNLGRILQFVKTATTSTVWGSASLRAERWLLAVSLLLLIGGLRLWRGRNTEWKAYLSQAIPGWLSLACLLPVLATMLPLAPLRVYLLILIPAIFAIGLLLVTVTVRPLVAVRPVVFPTVVALVLLLAPNARAFSGEQPMRHLVDFVRRQPNAGGPLAILGDSATTVCAYLNATGAQCVNDEWSDSAGYPRLDALMLRRDYQYVIVDNNMGYLLSQPTGLAEVVAGRDPRWQPAASFGQYQVFRRAAPPN